MVDEETSRVQAEAREAGGEIICVDTGWSRRGFASLNGTSVAIVFRSNKIIARAHGMRTWKRSTETPSGRTYDDQKNRTMRCSARAMEGLLSTEMAEALHEANVRVTRERFCMLSGAAWTHRHVQVIVSGVIHDGDSTSINAIRSFYPETESFRDCGHVIKNLVKKIIKSKIADMRGLGSALTAHVAYSIAQLEGLSPEAAIVAFNDWMDRGYEHWTGNHSRCGDVRISCPVRHLLAFHISPCHVPRALTEFCRTSTAERLYGPTKA
jgi:hypothetical protein